MSQDLELSGDGFLMDEDAFHEYNENNGLNQCNDESMPLGLNQLLNDPLKFTKNEFDFSHTSQTPRNQFGSNNDRKRKNPTRRCLSEVLDNSSYSTTPEKDLSPTFFSFAHKERLSSIESCSSALTPIFTRVKNSSSAEDSENDASMANSSMTSICSPLFSSYETNPMKKPTVPKIRKSNSLLSSSTKKTVPFVRCHSANEAQIKRAVEISCAIPSLIGDCSKPYALPLIQGKHQDLKSISVDILANVLEGHYRDLIEECVVVDCRYPYEYNGGHIRGAKNIYSQEAILQEFIRNKSEASMKPSDEKRHILVFHCEFSSERGPTLSRFLRNNDRSHNKDIYPHLHHPEIYLLEGGYKAFFEKYRNLCEPSEYLPMLSKDHEHELKRCRALVKSLSTDGKCMGSVFKTNNNRY